jgi:thymidylate kinase
MDTSSVAIFLVDTEGCITQANQRMAEMFGCPVEALEGKEYVCLVHPAERELSRLESIPSASPEYGVIRTYLQILSELPWAVETPDKIDLAEARKIMDRDHHDLDKVKRRIIEYLAVRKLKPTGGGAILCFVGPPGVGKTSLAKTTAILHTNSGYGPVYTACDPAGRFGPVMKDMLLKLAKILAKNARNHVDTNNELSITLSANPSIKYTRKWSKSESDKEIEEPADASEVIRLLTGFQEILSEPLCIVVDELETVVADDLWPLPKYRELLFQY